MTQNDIKIVADNIDDFIEVPDGVSRLRNAVLALAVSGKFVAEDKGDSSAEDLYKRIQVERLGQKKKVVELASLPEKEVPFEIPRLWKWVRLGDVCELIYGDGLPKEERKEDGRYKAYGANGPLALTNLTNCEMGGVIVGRKGSAGAVTLVPEPFFATDVTFFIPSGQYGAFDTNYLYFLLLALDLPQHAKGIKPGISRKEVYNLPVALPPLAAQKRIVKKIEEVMIQLDKLEVKKRERDETRTRLTRSVMQSLGKGESKIAFEHLPELIKTPSDLKELESALLALAVSGKLVAQDKNEGSARELFTTLRKSISAEAIREDDIEADFLAPPKEMQIDLPENWMWVKLGSITTKIGSGSTPRGGKDTYLSSGIMFLRSQNIRNEGLLLDDVAYISNDIHKRMKGTHVEPEDLLLNITGASLGRCTIVPSTLESANVSQHVSIIRMPMKEMGKFIHCCFLSPLLQNMIWGRQVGMAREGLSKGVLEKFEIPLPPLAEQKRIVEKVEEIMVLINQLKTLL